MALSETKPLTDAKFLDAIRDMVQSLERDIAAHALQLDTSPAARAERRRRALRNGDFWFFATTYFPHHIRGEPSTFHNHFTRRFPLLLRQQQGCREWWKAPRGEAKSSLATKIGPVWVAVQALLNRPEIRQEIGWKGDPPPFIDYVILLGAETSLPTKLLEVVKTELTANTALAMDFPEACGRGKVWKVGEAVTKLGVKVEPFGAEQAIRGTFHGASRPKLLLGDDLITDAEAKSQTERENRWTWLEKAIDYLGPPDGTVKYVGVGTELAKGDPINRAGQTVGHIVHHFKAIERLPHRTDLWEQCEELMRNADPAAEREASERGEVLAEVDRPSFRFYVANKEAMDQGAVTSWPSVRSLYWLMRQRAKNPKAFATEMQGIAKSDEDKVFSNITYWAQRSLQWLIFGACDPSMGKGESSDPSALLFGGFDREIGVLHVMHAEIKRRVYSKLEADLIDAQREFGALAIGFENNNAYEHMRATLLDAGIKKGVPLPLVGVTATVPAEMRIDSLEPYVTDRFEPKIKLHASLSALLAELDEWPEPQPHHHYDGLTGLHILWSIAFSRAVKFQYQSAGRAAGSRRGSHDRRR